MDTGRWGAERVGGTSGTGRHRASEILTAAPGGSSGMPDRVDDAEVRHVASLARVDLDDEEVELFAEQFADILEYFDALDEVPETDSEEELDNVMRPDEIREGLTQEEALQNAPETEDGYFKGPRVG